MTRFLALFGRLVVTLAMVGIALAVGTSLWTYYMDAPWTRDGRVRADVVTVTPDVSGLVTAVMVRDNQEVRAGDVLFRIDPERFSLALRQADAVVDGRKAAADQAAADFGRYSQLSNASVTQQRVEQAQAANLEAKASYTQALADRDVARLNLDRSDVRASVNGRITNMDLRPGAYVSVGHGVMALIDGDTLRVEGYFEETKLTRIHMGDAATVRIIGDGAPLSGHVESVAGGIEDRERSEGSSLLASVNPTFSWVRLAQRVPVRITLDAGTDRSRLVVGRTATVSIHADGEEPRSPFDGVMRRLSAVFPGDKARVK